MGESKPRAFVCTEKKKLGIYLSFLNFRLEYKCYDSNLLPYPAVPSFPPSLLLSTSIPLLSLFTPPLFSIPLPSPSLSSPPPPVSPFPFPFVPFSFLHTLSFPCFYLLSPYISFPPFLPPSSPVSLPFLSFTLHSFPFLSLSLIMSSIPSYSYVLFSSPFSSLPLFTADQSFHSSHHPLPFSPFNRLYSFILECLPFICSRTRKNIIKKKEKNNKDSSGPRLHCKT